MNSHSIKETLRRYLKQSESILKTDVLYLIRAGFWSNLNFIVGSAFALLLSVIFANTLPRDIYGSYQYLLSISALLTALCLSGMNNALTQSVARGNEGDLRILLKTQLSWNIVPTLVGSGIALYYFTHHNTIIGIAVAGIALLSPLLNTLSMYTAFLVGKMLFKEIFVRSTLINVAYYASIIVTAYFFKNATVLVLINLFINTLGTLVAYIGVVRKHTPNSQTDEHTVSYGIHLSVMSAFWTIMNQLDAILVFHILGPVELALYSIVTLLPERLAGFLNFIGTAALPKLANRTHAEIKQTLLQRTALVAILGAIGALLYAITAPFLFSLLFPKYMDAVHYTRIYAIVIMLLSVTNFVSSVLYAQRLKRELYLTNFVYPFTLVALQIPLLLKYGVLGMLEARIITDFISIAITLALIMKRE